MKKTDTAVDDEGDGGKKHLQNVGQFLPEYTV